MGRTNVEGAWFNVGHGSRNGGGGRASQATAPLYFWKQIKIKKKAESIQKIKIVIENVMYRIFP
jgi:hypothetical protein